ncbi:hypothetical protein [Cytobacillus luteolus]|nr:hypothetical protein [Cytobacillus luteolus]MBP1943362.1 hypothetical protein [Cytobacillus luteolus]
MHKVLGIENNMIYLNSKGLFGKKDRVTDITGGFMGIYEFGKMQVN